MSGDGNQSGRNRKPRPSGGSRASGNSRSSSDSRGKSPSGKSFGNSKGPKTTRGGDRFDSRDKYENGDRKFGSKKPFSRAEKDEDKTKSFIQKRRFDKISKSVPKESIRLNKYIANSGICSRREADELITQGLVEVNGKVVTEMGYQVQKTDRVVFDGQNITPEKPVYVLLNKPKGYISTTMRTLQHHALLMAQGVLDQNFFLMVQRAHG